jgi:hypothetical protein
VASVAGLVALADVPRHRVLGRVDVAEGHIEEEGRIRFRRITNELLGKIAVLVIIKQ